MKTDGTSSSWWTWVGPVSGGLAFVVAIAGLVSAQRTGQRLRSLESRMDAVVSAVAAQAEGGNRERTTPRRVKRRRPEGKAPRRTKAERPSPEKREKREERQQRKRDEVTAHVEEFASDQGLDESTVGRVLGELEARGDAVRAVLQDLAAGAVSADQAREEVQWVRDESAQTLRDLLGDEIYDELDRHLAERNPRRRRAAAATPQPDVVP